MAMITIPAYQCNRCQHIWTPRAYALTGKTKQETPTVCPSCKSPYWNKNRKTEEAPND